MTINWENIKYLFQIPLDWFKAIHNKVFHAYGTNFIRVRNGDDGGMHIDVDENTFAQQVLDVTGGGSGGGTVKSVDGVVPDSEGNVPLGAIRSINSHYYPDENGNIDVGLGVASVNGELPDENGNVEIDVGSVASVNNVTPDANGNVDLGSIVNTVNGTAPDANGNVNVGTVRAVNGITPTAGNVDLGTIIWSVDGIGTVDFHELHLNAVRSVNGITTDSEHDYNVDIDAVTSDELSRILADYVLSADLGNILTQYVTSSSLTTILADYVLSSELDNYVTNTSLATTLEDYVLKSELDDYVTETQLTTTLRDYVTQTALTTTLADYALTDDLGELAYMNTVEVDGHVSNTHGVVSFNLLGNKWLKSDANGHIVTTDDVPVAIDPLATGYLYNDGGTIQYKNEEYVTLGTTQTITATKNFENVQNFKGTQASVDMTSINGGEIALIRSTGTPAINMQSGQDSAKIDLGSGLTHALDITASTNINLYAPDAVGLASDSINLNAPTNGTYLVNPPDENAQRNAVATCGWAKDNFAPSILTGGNKWVKTDADGTITTTDEVPFVLADSSTGFLYNSNGTPSYLPFGNGPNTVAAGNHTHNTSQLNNDAGFITTPQAKTLIESYDYTTPTDVEDIVEGYDFVTEDDLEGYVTIGTEQNITGKKIFGPNASSGLEVYGDANANHLHFNRNLEVTGLGTKSFNVRCYNNQGQEGNMGLYAGSYTQFFSNVTAATILASAWAAMRISDGNGGYPVGCYFDNASKTARIWSSGGYSRMSYRDASGNDMAYLHIDETYCGLKHGTGGMLQVDGNGFEAKVGSNTYIEGGNAQLLLTCGNTSSPSIQFDNSINTIWLRSGSTADDSSLTIGRDGTKGALSIATPLYTHINGGGSTGGYLTILQNGLHLWGGNKSSIYAGERISLQWGSYPHVWINSSAEIQLDAPANQSKLYHHPTVSASDTNSYAIATCGWVANNFLRSNSTTYSGTRTVITGVNWTGTQLQFTRENWKYTNGQLESVTSASAITINTTTYP